MENQYTMGELYKYPEKLYRIVHTWTYKFLIQHPFLDACIAVIRKGDDEAFCKMVAGRNDLSMICHSFGGLHKDKNIYFIHHGNKNRGLFAQVNELLKYLAYADRFGFRPVVVWDSSLPYTEKEPIRGTKNPFEYYFIQPSGISTEDVYQSYNVFFAKDVHVAQSFLNREITNGENGYGMSEKYIEKLSEYVKKYIRLNLFTEEYLNTNISRMIDSKKTIGVHIRGTDYNNHYNNHPVNVSIEEYLTSIDELLQNGEYQQIFLATDDSRILQQFKDRYDRNLLCYYKDVVRADINQSVAFSKNARTNHKYLLGLEVLRDMYTLVACDTLVAGISQVSLMARVFRKSTGSDYRQKIILDKGYYRNHNNFVR